MLTHRSSSILAHVSLSLASVVFLFSFGAYNVAAMAIPSTIAFIATLIYHLIHHALRKKSFVVGTIENGHFTPVLDINTFPSSNFGIFFLFKLVCLWLATFIVSVVLNANRVRYVTVVISIAAGVEWLIYLCLLFKCLLRRKKDQEPVALEEDNQVLYPTET